MQFIEQIINNPDKIKDYINKFNCTHTEKLNIDEIFIYSLYCISLALNMRYINKIEKNRRIDFFNRCLAINRLTFGLLLKKGKESYEKAMKEDCVTTSLMTEQQEIDNVKLFLSNEGNSNIYKFINSYINRGIVHFFETINDKDFKSIINEALLLDGIELNYLEIRNYIYKQIHSINFVLESESTQQYLQFISFIGMALLKNCKYC